MVTNTTHISALPRRRPAGGDPGDRVRDRPVRRGDRHGPGGGAAGGTTSTEFPHTTVTGAGYDSGDYAGALDLALRSAGYDELRAEQKRRRDEGGTKQLGIGLSSYVEITNPLGEAELGEVEITPDGGAIVRTGSFSHGQGHETTLRDDRRRAARPAAREGHASTRATPTRSRPAPARTGRSRCRSAARRRAPRPTPSSSRRSSSSPTTWRRIPRTSSWTPALGRFHVAGHGRPLALLGGAGDARRRATAGWAS